MPQLRSSFATAYAHSVVCGFVVAGTTTVTDFLYNFLKSKYGVPSAIAEAGYNLVDALQRYQVRNSNTATGLVNTTVGMCMISMSTHHGGPSCRDATNMDPHPSRMFALLLLLCQLNLDPN